MRFFRMFLILLFCTIILLGSVYIYFTKKYPPEKIKQMAITWMSEQIGKPIKIETSSFHLLHGFQLSGIKLYHSQLIEREFIEIERIEFHYLWKSLLKGKLEISKIFIEKPILKLFSDGMVQKDTLSHKTEVDSLDSGIPFEFTLAKLEIHDGLLLYQSSLKNEIFSFSLSHIEFELQNLIFSQFDEKTFLQQIQYKLLGNIENGELEFSYKPTELFYQDSLKIENFKIKSICDFEINSTKDQNLYVDLIPIVGKLKLKRNSFKLNKNDGNFSTIDISEINLNLKGNMTSDLAEVNSKINFSLKDRFFIDLNSEIKNNQEPEFILNCDSLLVNLDSLFVDFNEVEWLYNSLFSKQQFQGEISIDSLKLEGKKKGDDWDFFYNFRNKIKNLSVKDFKQKISLSNLNGIITSDGTFQNSDFLNGNLQANFTLDSLSIFENDSSILLSQNGEFNFQSKLSHNFVPESLHVQYNSKSVLGAEFNSKLDFQVDNVLSVKDLDFQHIHGDGDFNLSGINLEQIIDQNISGMVDINLNLTSDIGDNLLLTAELETIDLSVEFDTTYGFELLPDIYTKLEGKFFSLPGFREIIFQEAQLILDDFGESKLSANFFPFLKELNIYFEEMKLDLPVAKDFFPSYLREEMISAFWLGEAIVSAEYSTWAEEGQQKHQIFGDIYIQNEIFDNPYWYMRLDSLNCYGIFGGNLEDLQIDMEGKIGELQIIDTTPSFEDINISSALSISNWNCVNIQSIEARQEQLDFRIICEGTIDNFDTEPTYFLSGSVDVNLDSSEQLLLGTYFDGNYYSQYSIFSQENNPRILQFGGWIEFDSLNINMENGLKLHNVQGRMPISQYYDLDTGYLLPVQQTQSQKFRLSLYEMHESYFIQPDSPYSLIIADSLVYKNYKADNIKMLVDYNQGSFFIPSLSMNMYDGNFAMRASMNLNSGALDDISYNLKGQLSRVNSSILPGVTRQSENESQIGITFDFVGQGIDPAREIDLAGQLEVTEIGSFATGNLLKSIDPYNVDPNIQSIRRMIKFGYKPKAISFQIKHDSFYPAIFLSQPWYSPVRISGGQISISRLPIKFLLDLMAVEAKPTM